MAKIDVTVSVEKSGMDLIQHLAALIVAVKAAHAGGANLQTALPLDVIALVAQLPAIVGDAQLIGGELAEDKIAFAKGVLIASEDLYKAIIA